LELFPDHADKIPVIVQMIERGINTPQTTSCGRLFDAVAAILQLKSEVNYEGQAAIILESYANHGSINTSKKEKIKFELMEQNGQVWIDSAPIIAYLIKQKQKGEAREVLAFIFHQALVDVFTDLIIRARADNDIDIVALSGGCFQNMLLLRMLTTRLRNKGLTVYTNRQVPANDGGISLGQAYWGMHNL
jgi:hydrogenase maturation protein HypF